MPFADLPAARAALSKSTGCAIIIEPIQAEGGIVVPPAGYLAGLRQICDETGTLLLFDEVQTGTGRTGKWWGHEHDGVTPDVMTLAKGLGGGYQPIGAMLASRAIDEMLATHSGDRKSTRLNSSHIQKSRMPSSA